MKYIIQLSILVLGWASLAAQEKSIDIDFSQNQNAIGNSLSMKGIEPFDEVETFEPGSFIWHIGSSLLSDLDIPNREFITSQVPGVHFTFEKCVAKNIGVGMKIGTQWWKADKVGYNYRYFSLGIRATYHFNLTERLDPYLGANFTGRRFSIGNGETNVNDLAFAPGIILGARYYLSDNFGCFAEYAEDGIGKVHLGITFKLK